MKTVKFLGGTTWPQVCDHAPETVFCGVNKAKSDETYEISW